VLPLLMVSEATVSLSPYAVVPLLEAVEIGPTLIGVGASSGESRVSARYVRAVR
jgi:hypothetical protein